MVAQSHLIQKTTLDNGLLVISERMSNIRSATVGIWVRSGSRHEEAHLSGISHFIEHALFKGTRTRSARDIAVESDAIGGNVDAFTSRELTGFYAKVLDEHLPRAFDLIADLVTEPLFDNAELDRERSVVIEEIKMVDDTPDDLVHEIFLQNFWPDHPLGRSILGTPKTLATFDQDRISQYFNRVYTPQNLIVAAAGNVEHANFVEMIAHRLGALATVPSQLQATTPQTVRPRVVLDKDLEQVHVMLGTNCPSMLSNDRYALHVLNTILGGGLSSRLFQTIREDRGLAYTVFSGISSYTDTGYLSMYAATSPGQLNELVELTIKEFARMKDDPVSVEELQRAKDQHKVSLMLSLESTSSRMGNLARQEIFFGRQLTLDETLQRIDAVTIADVQRIANDIFNGNDLAFTAIGQLEGFNVNNVSLAC